MDETDRGKLTEFAKAGVYRVVLIDQQAARDIDKAARAGDAAAQAAADVLGQYIYEVTQEPERAACLACDAMVDPKAIPLIAVLEPATDDSTQAIVNCLCRACITACVGEDSLKRLVVEAYGREVMVNPRVVDIHPDAGHA